MTAADLIRAVANHGVAVAADLSLKGSKPPPADLVAELRARKTEVVAHLLGLSPVPYPIDPVAETARFRAANGPRPCWLLGLGLLARRLVHATDPDVRSGLERLIRATPMTDAEFAAHETDVNAVLAALEAEGKLPPVWAPARRQDAAAHHRAG